MAIGTTNLMASYDIFNFHTRLYVSLMIVRNIFVLYDLDYYSQTSKMMSNVIDSLMIIIKYYYTQFFDT